MERPRPPRPEKVRDINSGSTWGWIDHRFEWFMDDMTQEEILLYLYLILKSDRNGCSWCSTRTIQKRLKMGPSTVIRARQMLEERGLIATEKDELSQRYIYQVMTLPIEENERVQIPIKKKAAGRKKKGMAEKAAEAEAAGPETQPEVGLKYIGEIMEKLRRP